MASMTFDLQWKESMVELLDQLELWDPDSAEQAKGLAQKMADDVATIHFT